MQQNAGSADRIIRVVGAALLAMLFFGANLSSPPLKAWMIMPLVLLAATAALGFCPLYALLDFDTCCPQRPLIGLVAPARALSVVRGFSEMTFFCLLR